MSTASTNSLNGGDAIAARTAELFKEQQQNIIQHTDQIFARLMICQFFFGVALALSLMVRASAAFKVTSTAVPGGFMLSSAAHFHHWTLVQCRSRSGEWAPGDAC